MEQNQHIGYHVRILIIMFLFHLTVVKKAAIHGVFVKWLNSWNTMELLYRIFLTTVETQKNIYLYVHQLQGFSQYCWALSVGR